jgi:hypothetical protein
VTVQPFQFWGDLGKGHAHLKRNASLFWDDTNRANLPNSRDNLVEQRPNLWWLSSKMVIEIVSTARVRLIAIGEMSPALGAPP